MVYLWQTKLFYQFFLFSFFFTMQSTALQWLDDVGKKKSFSNNTQLTFQDLANTEYLWEKINHANKRLTYMIKYNND